MLMKCVLYYSIRNCRAHTTTTCPGTRLEGGGEWGLSPAGQAQERWGKEAVLPEGSRRLPNWGRGGGEAAGAALRGRTSLPRGWSSGGACCPHSRWNCSQSPSQIPSCSQSHWRNCSRCCCCCRCCCGQSHPRARGSP